MSDTWEKFLARAARLQKKLPGFEQFKPEDFVVLRRYLDLSEKDRLPFVQDMIKGIKEREKTSDKAFYMAEVVLLKYLYEKGVAKGIFNPDLNGPLLARYKD
jgi:hypothetical protein